ncbi:flagellar basal body P-ring protein FlgI [Myxococcota bacterium]|nr:flagellar basal body P-ring protein FlgI [Myxococcota bacterium]
MVSRVVSLLVFAGLLLAGGAAEAARIKDLADVRGVRPNQLIGYGVVVGLNGTGDSDKTRFTIQSVVSMLSRMGIRVDARGLKLKNVAAVIVTSELPAFARAGNTIDITVSSLGDAKSLTGGTLVVTPLRGHDGQIYAMAQGPISVGGFSVEAQGGGASETKNHPTVARIPDGAMVEREINVDLGSREHVVLQIRDADFTTAARMAKTINMNLGGGFATTPDPGTVKVQVPPPYAGRVVDFVSIIERLEVTPDAVARVIVNERTGTIIMGQDVKIAPVAVAHGNLTVSVRRTEEAVPAAPLTPGDTVVTQNADIEAKEDKVPLVELAEGATLADVVTALNRLGATPRDMITILQAIKRAGALRADVEVM